MAASEGTFRQHDILQEPPEVNDSQKEPVGDQDRSLHVGRDAKGNVVVPGDSNKITINMQGGGTSDSPRTYDSRKYLEDLQANTSFIDIRGLQVGSARAPRFPIDELYIPLTTTNTERNVSGSPGAPDPEFERLAAGGEPQHVELHEMLRHRKLVIVGDPGAGKTTFAKRIAAKICQAWLDDELEPLKELGLSSRPLPVFIRVSELLAHIAKADDRKTGPLTSEAPMWLPHFLGTVCSDCGLELDANYFKEALQAGSCMVILDGLDEAASEQQRRSMSRLAEQASSTFADCQFVVTTRPAAYRHDVVLAGFTQVQVDSLENDAIEQFLNRWCGALFPENPRRAKEHCDEMLDALRSRIEIRRMARNPVMLTALAVMYWNEKRIPQQRADLYESVIGWLARARKHSEGRLSPERCVGLLQKLALAMQSHPEGRQVQVTRHWAANAIADQWREVPEEDRVNAADRFLAAEELDSGIIVGRGDHVRFWHLTFQEFLAARGLAALSDDHQKSILYADNAIYQPEWKEVGLLLAGVLYHQGIERVDRFVSACIDQLGRTSALADKAMCVGLVGAAVHDLSPVGYQPRDERYQKLLDGVLSIFETDWHRRATSLAGVRSRLISALMPRYTRAVLAEVAIKAADALGQSGDPRFSDANRKNNWVTMGPGDFTMGESGSQVVVDQFQIGRYPVTVGEFRRFVEHDGYRNEVWWSAGGFGKYAEPDDWDDQSSYPTRPVVGVSWFEAAAYAAFENCRLPTEEEWEFAARGAQGREYPWGDEEPEPARLNFKENIGSPTPVGVYPLGVTPEGICDLAGNVWEWCDSWYNSNEDSRVLRGGSFYYYAHFVRSAFRFNLRPDGRDYNYGFRVARTYR